MQSNYTARQRVAGESIRSRILKDPSREALREEEVIVAGESIRSRILKEDYYPEGLLCSNRGRGVDPLEDTERDLWRKEADMATAWQGSRSARGY